MAFKTDTYRGILSHRLVRIIWERQLVLSLAHHWEPSFVFALFYPQWYIWGQEMSWQESNLMTNTKVILCCVITVVQLYCRSCMTVFSTVRLLLREGASSRKEFAENIHGGFLTAMYVKFLLRSKLLGTLRSVCGLSIETVVLICSNCFTPGGAEVCFLTQQRLLKCWLDLGADWLSSCQFY